MKYKNTIFAKQIYKKYTNQKPYHFNNKFNNKMPNLLSLALDAPHNFARARLFAQLADIDLPTLRIDTPTPIAALLAHEVDAVIAPLPSLSTQLPVALTIAALLPSLSAATCLVIRAANYDPTAVLKLPTNAVIGVQTAVQQAQLLDYRRDIRCIVLPNLDTELPAECTAFLLPEWAIPALETLHNIADFRYVVLHPTEFVPCAGEGATALVCRRDDEDTVQRLRAYNDAKTVHCCNVARKLLQQMGEATYADRLAAYCTTDANDNYHTYIAYAKNEDTPALFFKHSQANRTGLVEKLAGFLEN